MFRIIRIFIGNWFFKRLTFEEFRIDYRTKVLFYIQVSSINANHIKTSYLRCSIKAQYNKIQFLLIILSKIRKDNSRGILSPYHVTPPLHWRNRKVNSTGKLIIFTIRTNFLGKFKIWTSDLTNLAWSEVIPTPFDV